MPMYFTKTGASAYEIAVSNGFVGTEADWLASLAGTDGANGASAYDIWIANGGSGTEQDFLNQIDNSTIDFSPYAQLSGANFSGPVGVNGGTVDANNQFAFYGTNFLLNSGSDINMKFNKNAAVNDASMTWQTGFSTKALAGLLGNDDWTLKVGSGYHTALVADEATGEVSMPNTPKFNEFTEHVGGAFLLDPNEINGWGFRGRIDEIYTVNLGTPQTTNLARVAGGLMFPFDVRLKRFQCFHYNSNPAASAWGWVIAHQTKAATPTAGSNSRSTTFILNEVTANGGVGPRNYLNTVTQQTDLSFNAVIPAGDVITLAVAAPTAATIDYFVNVLSGYLLFERI